MNVPPEAQPHDSAAAPPPAALPEPTPDATAAPKPKVVLNIDSFDPPPDMQLRLVQVAAAANPLLEAAQPLLRALAEMPAQVKDLDEMNCLREMLVREIKAFQTLCDKADLSWKHMAAVRFCICTALDEAANRNNLGGGSAWAMKSLLIEIEGESDGGEKFFLLIGRMATDPQEYLDVLEVLYRILGLGFEGRYSVIEDGRRHLDQIRQRLLTLIGNARETVPPELSPHWRGEGAGRLPLLRSVPVWATASFFALILFGVFCWYQYQLLDMSNALQQRILAIAKEPVSVPAQPLPQVRLAILLKDEIARGLVTVAEDARRSVVTFKGDTMFVAGRSQVRPEIEPTLDKVAREVARVGGHVRIIGHTDSQPIRTAEFPNNQVLSEKRAAFVGQYLQSRGTPGNRIEALGRGDSLPVAGNATAAERARNRRVEIVVTQ
ncbi:type VI secretion system protein TssL, long form [Paraherbaspirillum soli]|uniref:Type VI secretion system protein TssL, long form n=2 Tax=Paraherbaspirillum soli TaxID=631222 RepID=A0ABW0M595_9BURK